MQKISISKKLVYHLFQTTYFWLQVLFLHPGEQRAAVMSGEEIMVRLELITKTTRMSTIFI